MRLGKPDKALTAIATSDDHSITVRGHDLCRDLIGQVDFTDCFGCRSAASARPRRRRR